MASTTAFGKAIMKTLVDQEHTQNWLIDQVKEKTGLYFDSSYLFKIKTGALATPKIVTAICEVLGLRAEEFKEE